MIIDIKVYFEFYLKIEFLSYLDIGICKTQNIKIK